MKKPTLSSRLVRNSVVLVVLAVFGLALVWTYFLEPDQPEAYTYSQLLAQAQDDPAKIESVVQDGNRLSVKLEDSTEPRTVIVPTQFIDVRQQLCDAAGQAIGDCEINVGAVEESAAKNSVYTPIAS